MISAALRFNGELDCPKASAVRIGQDEQDRQDGNRANQHVNPVDPVGTSSPSICCVTMRSIHLMNAWGDGRSLLLPNTNAPFDACEDGMVRRQMETTRAVPRDRLRSD